MIFSNDVTETPHKKKNNVDSQTPDRKRQSLFEDDTNEIKLNKSQTFPPLNSTPKLTKTTSEFSLRESPISPLYRNNNSFSSPKPRSGKKFDKSPICLGDFIIHNRKSSGKKKRNNEETKTTKRINPTSLMQTKIVNGNFDKCENSFNFMEGVREIPAEDVRNVLVEERMRIVSRGVPSTPSKFRTFSIDKSEIVADVNGVRQREKLDVLVRVYSVILRNNLALNLSSELYFVVSLLFSKQNDVVLNVSDDNCGISVLNESDASLKDLLVENKRVSLCRLFSSVHNVVYFSVKTIEELFELFKIFDKAILKLLAEHKYIVSFSPQLHIKLMELFQNKTEKSEEFYDSDSEVNVCFISDTDNRENFPNDQAFGAFRKQRDLFYEILRIWEKFHLTSGWNFNIALGGKIRSLLALHHEGVNYMHLARLFKNQLLSTYRKQNSVSLVLYIHHVHKVGNVDSELKTDECLVHNLARSNLYQYFN